ncbi:hypothetical protein BT96DRAFT_1013441 [Gymnopus androsaceus JB14]|uniref:Uncharacterized protein n=1 Tax=Gymnopus androsaceus JB14 TaxID=1447944 RepID=A0A6A4ICR2_9AGAR|nr:hypothetical protein BT96DRAFT_1013441 [Gymnopus androsaceus JB14]
MRPGCFPSRWFLVRGQPRQPPVLLRLKRSTLLPLLLRPLRPLPASNTTGTKPTGSPPVHKPVHAAFVKVDDEADQEEAPVIPEVELANFSQNEVHVPEAPLSPTSGTKFVEALDENEIVIAPVSVIEPVAPVVEEAQATEPATVEPPSATETEAEAEQTLPVVVADSVAIAGSDEEPEVKEEPVERPTSPVMTAMWKYLTG